MSNITTNNAILPMWRNITLLRGDSLETLKKRVYHPCAEGNRMEAIRRLQVGSSSDFFDDPWEARVVYKIILKEVGVKICDTKDIAVIYEWE